MFSGSIIIKTTKQVIYKKLAIFFECNVADIIIVQMELKVALDNCFVLMLAHGCFCHFIYCIKNKFNSVLSHACGHSQNTCPQNRHNSCPTNRYIIRRSPNKYFRNYWEQYTRKSVPCQENASCIKYDTYFVRSSGTTVNFKIIKQEPRTLNDVLLKLHSECQL